MYSEPSGRPGSSSLYVIHLKLTDRSTSSMEVLHSLQLQLLPGQTLRKPNDEGGRRERSPAVAAELADHF